MLNKLLTVFEVFKIKKDKTATIVDYLLSNKYELHDNNDSKIVFIKCGNVVQITKLNKGERNKGRVLLDVDGEVMFMVSFIPSVMLFKILMKKATRDYGLSC